MDCEKFLPLRSSLLAFLFVLVSLLAFLFVLVSLLAFLFVLVSLLAFLFVLVSLLAFLFVLVSLLAFLFVLVSLLAFLFVLVCGLSCWPCFNSFYWGKYGIWRVIVFFIICHQHQPHVGHTLLWKYNVRSIVHLILWKYVFDVTSTYQHLSSWSCNKVKVKIKSHPECKPTTYVATNVYNKLICNYQG